MTERRLERSAVHRGDLILVNAQLPFAGPEEQDRVCLDANVMLARRAAEPLRRLVRAGACQRMALAAGAAGDLREFSASERAGFYRAVRGPPRTQ